MMKILSQNYLVENDGYLTQYFYHHINFFCYNKWGDNMIVNYSDQKVIKGKKSIFLAGPTPREANCVSWRVEAIQLLEKLGFDGVVYVPEYSTMKPKADYVDQVMWERMALIEATVICFWVPRELTKMPGFTTNVEFGYWLHSNKVVYGRPDNAEKVRYLDWLYELDYKLKPKRVLIDVLSDSIALSNQLHLK